LYEKGLAINPHHSTLRKNYAALLDSLMIRTSSSKTMAMMTTLPPTTTATTVEITRESPRAEKAGLQVSYFGM